VSLGTDGFGRSENRVSLRDFFEVDAKHIVLATLHALAGEKSEKKDGGEGVSANSWRRQSALESIRRNVIRLSVRTKELTAPEGAVDFENLRHR